ncbi:MoaD/ThiS family protein [Acetobacteraceae bacterium KSS8]|uniref:MoaD/ThiS family protein n=1 Tax=Endosaccharibacter trunci TaxID=2812733 RepID=A0ABT1WAX4_9PROT|nr:MoaD/ThiS family protein [Acetobacteraceae bacterium KSS8]
MITVELRYYAQLREQAGTGGERVSTDAETPAALYDTLRLRHGFSLPRDALKIAVNTAFCSWETRLRDGDVVVFVPPVNGG